MPGSADPVTVDTYDRNARALAEYFAGIGTRVPVIEQALVVAGNPTAPRVVEVGCGDGRDAVEIVPRTGWYEGFDPSAELIELARVRNIAGARFGVADALSYEYPRELDAVFGFASFLHLNRDDFATACERVAGSLRSGGVLAMTLKERDAYEEELVEDDWGKRWFYYYDAATVRQITERQFEVIELRQQTLTRKTARWLYVVLRKK